MLSSAYLGQHPDKVDHVVLAEPGFLTSELAEEWAEAVRIRFTPGVIYHFVKTKFESLHIKGPDDHASDDYFGHQMNMYQGSDHPQIGYYCAGTGPQEDGSWRFGARAANSIQQQAVDADGNFDINLVEGVERFTNKVLFVASECQTVIGVEWQTQQMAFFANAELAVIPDAGHEMFAENPEASLAVVRAYLNAPVQ
jgi:proline iminopeptidase